MERRNVSEAVDRNQTPSIKISLWRFTGSYIPNVPDPGFLRGKGSNERSAVRYHLYQSTMRNSVILSMIGVYGGGGYLMWKSLLTVTASAVGYPLMN